MTLMDRRRALMMEPPRSEDVTFLDNGKVLQIGNNISTDDTTAQGGCYCNGKIYFFAVTNSTTQSLYSKDLASGTVTKHATYTTLSHANSMTYDPTNNVFYVATMEETIGIVVIDASDYTITRTFILYGSLGGALTPWAIAFDRKRNVLYNKTTSSLIGVYSTTGTLLRTITLSNPQTHTTEQGLETDGQYIYSVWSSPSNCIDVYTISGTYVKTITFSGLVEMEELEYDWNGRFYLHTRTNTNVQGVYAAVFRTFNGEMLMSPVPTGSWFYSSTGGSFTDFSTVDSFKASSTASAGWSLLSYGRGFPFSYTEIEGKTIKLEYDAERISGSSGDFASLPFTTNTATPTRDSDTLYKGEARGPNIPSSGEDHVIRQWTTGSSGDFKPASDKKGTYIGWRIFFHAASGNSARMKNLKWTVVW